MLKEIPPKTHHLKYLVHKINIGIDNKIEEIIFDLDDLSVPTRYPETLQKILSAYDNDKTKQMISDSEKVLKWINKEFLKY